LDVAGEDEGAIDGEGELRSPGRDSTALTVVEVDLTSLADELIKAPTYRVVCRQEWTGIKHTTLYGQIKALAEHWQARYLVVDATGVGAGLSSFLEKALPGRVIPFVFTQKSKSDLGWSFLAVVETGRYKEYIDIDPLLASAICKSGANQQQAFWQRVNNCQMSILEGPGKIMRWGVPDGTRDAVTGELVHDDLLISAALCAVLDACEWGLARSQVRTGQDLFEEMREAF